MAESKLIENLVAARRAGVPLLAIETSDPASCIRQVKLYFKNKNTSPMPPLVSWDISEGFKPQNSEGEQELVSALGATEDGTWPVDEASKAYRIMLKFKRNTICFFLNAHWYFGKAENVQAFWNLRDDLKKDKRMAIILCPSIKLPPEIKHDVVVLEDPLPGTEELKATTKAVYEAAKKSNNQIKSPSDDEMSRIIEAVRGLSTFEAEQDIAMSLDGSGMNFERLWKTKKKSIEMSPSLKIYQGNETFEDVKGLPVFKEFLTKVMNGNDRPTVVVFWDEIEKAFAGSQSDSSGVSQEMHGQILSWMADNDVPACRMMGHPGCAKSYVSKAVGGQFGRPVIMMNISEAKDKYVGVSTHNLKNDLNVVTAVGRPIILATCNNEESLSPELRDRFSLGTWFFDLPTDEELKAVFDIWMKKFNLKGDLPKDIKDWTHRNAHDCCVMAWRLKCSLEEASKFIVPVKRSNPQSIEERRRKANGKYLSVSYEGPYQYKKLSDVTTRAIDFENVGNA